ncbi:MAG TPA: sialidase family protein [Kofleriaceae bacterium]|nr:sialidase family protein [Kofleriaceae bacterium]
MRTALAGLLVLGLAATAHANGRDPYTSTINFQRGNDQHIIAGMTFGAVTSSDGGATWNWMCERAIGYGGQYDPDYVYSSTGAIFATTFDGLKVMRNEGSLGHGCGFTSTPPGMTFVSKTEGGPDGAIYYAAADMADAKIYKSTDDGMTFPTSANPGQPGDWWSSLAVAPSNAQRVYVTGYRLDGMNPKVFLLYTSTNGGTSYTAMNMTGITPVSANSTIEVVGISPTTDTTLYVKVTFENGSSGDSLYRSTNAGQSWTKILSKNSNFGLAFVVRKDGTTCVAGTRELGSWSSTNCSTAATPTWTLLTNAPHIGCLYNDSAGNVWACTQNYASPQLNLPSDGFGIMKTNDLTNWTGVLKYQDIKAPVACPGGTVQEDQCVQKYMDQQSAWCCLVPQLGITSTAIDCNGALACFGNTVDGAPDAGTNLHPPDPTPCCGTSDARSSALLSLFVTAVLLLRRRRPKEP